MLLAGVRVTWWFAIRLRIERLLVRGHKVILLEAFGSLKDEPLANRAVAE
ncbi:hypothetical protein [Novosphingobium sp. M1R2S20]|uniref:Uncharacterized protein n=1 Tax=Novosphingobium rhizovicinum TaxID=3228928 RepID=A0ABV3REC1_9SPHN